MNELEKAKLLEVAATVNVDSQTKNIFLRDIRELVGLWEKIEDMQWKLAQEEEYYNHLSEQHESALEEIETLKKYIAKLEND